MNTVELLNKKIEELRSKINNVSPDVLPEQQQISNNLLIIDVALDALTFEDELLSDEDKFLNYNFEGVISLLSGYEEKVEKLNKVIRDVKTIISMKKDGEYSGAYSQNQTKQLTDFIKELQSFKEELTEELKKTNNNEDTELLMLELESLRDEMSSSKKRKNITFDMAEALYTGYDILNADPKEVEDLFEDLYLLQGGRVRKVVQRADFNAVLKLYKEFVSPEKIELFEGLLNKYRDEITANIDLDNARAILKFFKEVNILDLFERKTLLNISLYGDSEYVKTIYEKIYSNPNKDKEIYFQDILSSVWICKERRRKKPSSGTRRKNAETTKIKSLASECFNFTYNDFEKNASILAENIDVLDIKNPQVFGAHLRDQCLSSEDIEKNKEIINYMNDNTGRFRKNILIGRALSLGQKYKIPVSFFKGDAEEKLHLSVELGLLNPPITSEFLKYEEEIDLVDRFNDNHPGENIRNYYSRFMSKIVNLSKEDYDNLFLQLHDLGPKEFYKGFFSSKKAGEGSNKYKKSVDDIERLVANKFVKDWYSAYINNYDRYDLDISDYNEYISYSNDIPKGYYDEDILDDPLIQKLEERHCVVDRFNENGEIKEEKNSSVYLFGNTIISRLKVLKNASILRNKYGYLNEDMLLSSIVRNSYLTEESFQNIYDEAYERSTTL